MKGNCKQCGQPCCDKCGSSPCSHEVKPSYNEIVNSEGELLFVATRATQTISQDLPYFIWGTAYVNNLDASVLAPYLGTGTTVVLSHNANGDLVFTYTNGINTDIITVTTTAQGLISYIEAVQNLQTNYMISNYMLYGVNIDANATFLTQANINTLLTAGIIMQNLDAVTNVGGGKKKHLIIPRSRTMPNNSMPNVVEIFLRREKIKSNTVWINKFAKTSLDPAPAISNAFTIFISDTVNMNEEAEKIAQCL